MAKKPYAYHGRNYNGLSKELRYKLIQAQKPVEAAVTCKGPETNATLNYCLSIKDGGAGEFLNIQNTANGNELFVSPQTD